MTELLKIALTAAHEASKDIMHIYNDPSQDFGIERKADNSPLTLADKASHQCIVRHLQSTGLPILSEEGAQQPYAERAKWERYWLIDPLDGTKEFIKKNGEFTVNIALIEHGIPVMGVVDVPAKGICYYGTPDGAFRLTFDVETLEQGTPICIPQPRPQDDAFVIVASRSHLSPETQQYIDEAAKHHDNVVTISSGSSIKLCLVAEGAADAYPRFAPTMEWDTAAADAVVRAAGRMTYQAGTNLPLVYNKEDLHNPWFLVK